MRISSALRINFKYSVAAFASAEAADTSCAEAPAARTRASAVQGPSRRSHGRTACHEACLQRVLSLLQLGDRVLVLELLHVVEDVQEVVIFGALGADGVYHEDG